MHCFVLYLFLKELAELCAQSLEEVITDDKIKNNNSNTNLNLLEIGSGSGALTVYLLKRFTDVSYIFFLCTQLELLTL